MSRMPPDTALPAVRSDDPASASDAMVRHIYQTVFERVMSQQLAPGTKLPEAALCQLFNVGRTTVQKALQKLAHEHIVELRPNRGAIVAMPTAQEMHEIFEARRSLEAAVLALAVKRATKKDVAALRRHLKEEHTVMHTYRQTDWARLASSFHLRVAELSRNPILQRYLGELLSRCSLIVALHEPGGHASCEHDEHARIVDCIASGDVDGAVRAMDEHLQELEQRIKLVAQQSGTSLARMLGVG
jgi:DNA-binding GntR family transcriptional regulator